MVLLCTQVAYIIFLAVSSGRFSSSVAIVLMLGSQLLQLLVLSLSLLGLALSVLQLSLPGCQLALGILQVAVAAPAIFSNSDAGSQPLCGTYALRMALANETGTLSMDDFSKTSWMSLWQIKMSAQACQASHCATGSNTNVLLAL